MGIGVWGAGIGGVGEIWVHQARGQLPIQLAKVIEEAEEIHGLVGGKEIGRGGERGWIGIEGEVKVGEGCRGP